MKKIALVTCYFQRNYGSQLQAYATQLLFDRMGIPNETICIDGLQKEIKYAKYKYFFSKLWDIDVLKDKWSTIKKTLAKRIKSSQYKANVKVRDKMFDDFSHSKFHISQVYNSKKEITINADKYSAFVVGSDQLWLPSNIEADYYSLNFVPANIPKIALSTSFGVSALPSKQARLASVFLRRIEHVSVREISGQKIIKDLTGRDVPIVCDPTILFTAQDWSLITSHRRLINAPYLFCYFLGNSQEHRDFVRRVKQVTGYKIVQLQHCDEYIKRDEKFPDYAPYDIGPAEFIQLIRDAEYVFTDSFHASVFSLLHEKRFFTFRRYKKDGTTSTNGRLYSLLSLVKQEDRLLTGYENVNDVLNSQINYEEVHNKLNEFRSFTKAFVSESLKECGIVYDTNYK